MICFFGWGGRLGQGIKVLWLGGFFASFSSSFSFCGFWKYGVQEDVFGDRFGSAVTPWWREKGGQAGGRTFSFSLSKIPNLGERGNGEHGKCPFGRYSSIINLKRKSN